MLMNFYKNRKSATILNKCRRAVPFLLKYPERLTDEGIAEALILCVCCSLFNVRDDKLMVTLIRYITNDSEV